MFHGAKRRWQCTQTIEGRVYGELEEEEEEEEKERRRRRRIKGATEAEKEATE